MKLEKTASGKLALWEHGGGHSNTGTATVIADKNGNPKTAIYIKRRGELACSNHALFEVQIGDIVCKADHHRGDFRISLQMIMRIYTDTDGIIADTYQIALFEQGEWQLDKSITPYLPMIEAAKAKSQDYHCRHAYFESGSGITRAFMASATKEEA
jgi:hypothetical protein